MKRLSKLKADEVAAFLMDASPESLAEGRSKHREMRDEGDSKVDPDDEDDMEEEDEEETDELDEDDDEEFDEDEQDDEDEVTESVVPRRTKNVAVWLMG